MRIAKSTHLKRLLKTQDVMLGTLTFLVVVDVFYWMDWLHGDSVIRPLLCTPLVLLFCLIGTRLCSLALHGRSMRGYVFDALKFSAVIVGGLIAIDFAANVEFINRRFLVPFGVLCFLVLFINRQFLSWWYLQGRQENEENFLKVLIIGSGPRAQHLMQEYRAHSDWGIEIVGMLDLDTTRIGSTIEQAIVIGDVRAIHDVLGRHVVDEVVVCVPRSQIDNLQTVVDACQEQGVCLNFLADFYDMQSDQISLEEVGNLVLLRYEPVAQDEGKLVLKRMLDLMVTLLALPFALIVFAIVAIAIKLDDPGPVFFRQERVGLNKRLFKMFKFRSMVVNAEAKLKEIEHLNEAAGPIFKMENDPRVTRVGRFIRRTSIDELPQIINVLLGHMSIIGPRPMSVRDVSLFSRGVQRKRFSVRPGLLCLREVSGRSQLSFERWLELDLQYIDEWSLWLDLKILMRAIPAILRGSGAV